MGKYGFIGGCVLLFVSVFGFIQWMSSYETTVSTTPVLMARKYIPAHTKITEEMVVVQSVDARLKNVEAIHDPTKVIGKETLIPMGTNEQFVPWKLEERNLYPNPGQNYFTFKMGVVSSVGNMIRRGDIVRIWLEMEDSVATEWRGLIGEEDLPAAMVVIGNAKVAYVKDAQGNEVVDQGNSFSGPFAGVQSLSDSTDQESDRMTASADTVLVTYILSDAEYERLVRADRFGELKMSLPWHMITSLDQKNGQKGASVYDFESWFTKLIAAKKSLKGGESF